MSVVLAQVGSHVGSDLCMRVLVDAGMQILLDGFWPSALLL